jgi:hypothetical protein
VAEEIKYVGVSRLLLTSTAIICQKVKISANKNTGEDGKDEKRRGQSLEIHEIVKEHGHAEGHMQEEKYK